MNDEDYKEYRDLMIRIVEELDPGRNAALALSGGVDSTTALFAMLETGRKPRCYTFYLENTPSEDLLASRNLARHFGLELVEVEMPWDIEKLVADIRELLAAALSERTKKTVIQCMHPWKYIAPIAVANGDKLMLCGLGGDDQFCTQRKVQVLLNTKGEQAVRDAGWRKCYTSDIQFSGGNILNYSRGFGLTLRDVYDDQRMTDWFNKYDIKALHRAPNGKKLEKAASIYAFKDWYSKGNFYREPSRYQIASKLKQFHMMLLDSPYNQIGAKDVVAIYNQIRDGRL